MTQFALLWSQQQNAVHVEPLERLLSLNRESYTDDQPVHFAPLAVGTREEMEAAAEAMGGTLAKRGERPTQPDTRVARNGQGAAA